MLCHIYFKIGEFGKVIRHSESLNLDTVSDHALHILLMSAESHML